MVRKEEPVSTGKFYMLRCLIALAHADGVVSEPEIAYISGILNRIGLTAQQRQILNEDFQTARQIEDLLPYINEPTFRAHVIDFARILAHKDGELHPNEDAILKKLHASAIKGVDMDSLRQAVKKAVDKEMRAHDIEIQKNRPVKGGHIIPWFQFFDEILLTLGIDLLKE